MNHAHLIVQRGVETLAGSERVERAWVVLLAAGVLLAGKGSVTAQCTDPPMCGQWEGPFDLDISCPSFAACPVDEIVHASLIPSGVHKGDVVVWTRCHGNRQTCNTGQYAYKSHVVDPQTMSAVAHPTFDTAYPPGVYDGPFCSGHAWMLDKDQNPKLLVAGGVQFVLSGGVKQGTGYSSNQTFWFDPESTAIVPGSNPPETQYWFDGPGTLSMLDNQTTGSWYPSVLTYFDPASNPPRFHAIAIGGTKRPAGGCKRHVQGLVDHGLADDGSSPMDERRGSRRLRMAVLPTSQARAHRVWPRRDHLRRDRPCLHPGSALSQDPDGCNPTGARGVRAAIGCRSVACQQCRSPAHAEAELGVGRCHTA